ncbi:GerAB/ArcD/ProY family transporter [Bacillus sp. CECT 9360]|uniref:GerAB/ArcD/ProY family transporter n=1 Tax=Bacillus sp. CECT 9360 TaxID=2845821 RepID=UPI001E560D94|nr:GerAB/ArcD/ProY family transporter [Bacillus sp. CECT 9360]CAH0344210.1 Spore germination protein A2 [Bacillus sp. CECT 9360]
MKEKLHYIHLVLLIYLIQTGVALFSLPNILAYDLGTNGWIAVLLVSMLISLNILLIGAVYKLGKGKSLFIILENGLPRPLLYPLYIFLLIVWSLLACIVGKQYMNLYQIIRFHTTPVTILKLTYDVLVYLLLIKGLYNIAKASTIIFSITIFLALLFTTQFHGIELARFTPFLFKEGNDWLHGMIDTYIAFLGFELSLLFIPYINKESRFIKAMLVGNLITTFIYTYTCFVIFGYFGHAYLRELLFPLMNLLSTIHFPFLERLENLLYGLFLFKVLITSVMYYWAATEAAKRIFKRTDEKLLSFLIIAITYFISLVPGTLDQISEWLSFLSKIEIAIAIGLPAVAILLLMIQKGGKKYSDVQNR